MQVLSMMGYTGTPIGQLHNELFRAGGPHKFPYRYMDAKTVTDLLHSCGGVVVLAHPGQYKADNVMEMMIEEHMLDGIELNHPRNNEKTREHITSLCKEHDLFMTGGTDFHGLYTKTPYPLGSFLCPKEGLQSRRTKLSMKNILNSKNNFFIRKNHSLQDSQTEKSLMV